MEDRGGGTAPMMNNAPVTGGGAFRSLAVVFFVWFCIGGGFAQSDDNCTTSSIGNGACDPENNNEDCDYDGGDCCDCTSNDWGWNDYSDYCDSFFSSSSTVCRDPESECVHPCILYPECTDGIFDWIADGWCDGVNNNERCGYDGGDCCECSCIDSHYSCGIVGYACADPNAGCPLDPRIAKYPDCTVETVLYEINDGYCKEFANTPECDYDGGDCCPCTCSDMGGISCSVFSCLDPHAPSVFYDCEDPPLAVRMCEPVVQRNWVVENTSDVQVLAEALNCSGGSFQVTWEGHVIISETINVVNRTVLNVTGAGPVATIAGASKTRLFTVVNASLNVDNLYMIEGNATSGGAVGALASTLTFKNVKFAANEASVYGGALFLSGGSNVTFDGPCEFVDNFASLGGALSLSGGSNVTFDGPCEFVDNFASYGGALFLEDGSKASWVTRAKFSWNSATVEGGAVFFTGESSGLWFGQSNFTSNTAYTRGGALYVADGSNIRWTEEIEFRENQACYGAGGSLYVTEGSEVSWTGNTLFSGNKAWYKGGALYVSGKSTISWAGSTDFFSNTVKTYSPFDDDSVSSGYSSSSWDWNHCTSPRSSSSSWYSYSYLYSYYFSNSYSYDYSSSDSYSDDDFYHFSDWYDASEGGALFVQDGSNVSWSADTNFSENTADIGGAILITSGSTVEWTGLTTFFSNAAASDGGSVGSRALDATATSSSSLNSSSGSIFSYDNIYSYSSWIPNGDKSKLIIGGNTVFEGNMCGARGGALALLGMLTLTINTASVTFSRNFAGAAGGAVLISSTDVGPKFIGTLFEANSAPVGGAVFASGSGTKETEQSGRSGGSFYENPTTFRNCTFIDNEADATGGAAESAFGLDMFIGTTFKGNKASGGGALRLTGVARIFWCIFEENKSDVEGGPAVAYFGTFLEIENSNFIDNIFSCSYGTYLDFSESDNIFETVCKNCGEECSSCEYGRRTEVPLECVPLSKDGLDEHAKSCGGPLSELIIEDGYWRATSNSKRIRECYHEKACTGGVTGAAEFCAEGYKGSYCAVCIENWYMTGVAFKCKKCSNEQRIWAIVIAAVLGVFIVLCLLVTYSHLMSGEVGATGQGIADRVIRRVPLQAVKIIIVAWQIESQFSSAANVEYPPIYREFLERVAWVDFNWSRLISSGCLLDISFYDRLLALTIAPIVILALLMMTYAIASCKHRGSESALRTVRSKHMSMVLLVTFLVYSSASTIVFQMFDCEDLDNNKTYNRADYSVECDTDLHNKLEWYAGFMILVYPVGIPAFYAFLLYRHRDILVNEVRRRIEPSVESTSDLWAPYKPSRFYYEVLECGRRVLLTGVVLLLEGDTAAQIAVTFMIAVSFAFVFEGLDPYESRWDTWIGRIGHAVVCTSMFFALLLKVSVSGESNSSQKAFEVTIVTAHVCMILAVITKSVVMACALRAINQQEEDPVPRPRISHRLPVTADNLLVFEDESCRGDGKVGND